MREVRRMRGREWIGGYGRKTHHTKGARARSISSCGSPLLSVRGRNELSPKAHPRELPLRLTNLVFVQPRSHCLSPG